MSLFFREVESRAITENDVPWFGPGVSTVRDVDGALRLIPFYAATTGIADDIAVMPWAAFRDSGQGWGAKITTPAILTSSVGIFGLDFIGWMNQCVMSMLVRGFAFGIVIGRTGGMLPSQIMWVHPDRVNIDESHVVPVFSVDGRVVDPMDVVYIPGPLVPGSVRGLSPVALFRLQLTKAKVAQQYAADFYSQGIMPPGILKNTAKQTFKPGELDTAKARFKASVSGRDIFVTGRDWEWNALTIPRDDAAFLDTIKASATEIAAIFRVAPEDIGGSTGDSMTYQSVEMAELKRNRRALLPWVRRIEDALTDLLPRPQYVKANMDALVRTDLLTRTNAHQVALVAGLETNTEARALEDRPPLTPEEFAQWREMYGDKMTTTLTGPTPGSTPPPPSAKPTQQGGTP